MGSGERRRKKKDSDKRSRRIKIVWTMPVGGENRQRMMRGIEWTGRWINMRVELTLCTSRQVLLHDESGNKSC